VIDNSATCIICNDRNQFVGHLERQDCQVETSVGKDVASTLALFEFVSQTMQE